MRIIYFKNVIQIVIIFLVLLGVLVLPVTAFPQENEDTETSEKPRSERQEAKYRIYILPFQKGKGVEEIKDVTIEHISDKFEERLINSKRFTVNVGPEDIPELAKVDILDARTIVKHLQERWAQERIDPAQYIIVGTAKVLGGTEIEVRIEVSAKLIDVYTQSYINAESVTCQMKSNLEALTRPTQDLADQISQSIPLYGMVTSVDEIMYQGMPVTEVGINFGSKRGVRKGMKFEVFTERTVPGPDRKPVTLPSIIRCMMEIAEVEDEAAKGRANGWSLRIEAFKDKVRTPPPLTVFEIASPPGEVWAGETYPLIIVQIKEQHIIGNVSADDFYWKIPPSLGEIKKDEQGKLIIQIADDVPQLSKATLEATWKQNDQIKATKEVTILPIINKILLPNLQQDKKHKRYILRPDKTVFADVRFLNKIGQELKNFTVKDFSDWKATDDEGQEIAYVSQTEDGRLKIQTEKTKRVDGQIKAQFVNNPSPGKEVPIIPITIRPQKKLIRYSLIGGGIGILSYIAYRIYDGISQDEEGEVVITFTF